MAFKDIWKDIVDGDFIDPKQINDVAHSVIDNENRTNELENEIHGENGWNEQAKEAARNAKLSETNAKSSEDNAKTSETKSKTSEENAKASEDEAKNAQNKSEQAQSIAETASNEAKTAANTATNKAQIATEAKEASEEARDDAEIAKELAEDAATKAENAADRAENATEFLKNGALFANALRGLPFGASVSADDVSPVEHELDVNVHGKNLFKMPDKITTNDNTVEIIDNDIVITNISSNSWTNTNKTLKELCPSLKVGDTVILTFTTTTSIKYFYLNSEQKTWESGKSYTVTATSLLSHVVLYCTSELNSVTTISNIQIEKGTVATEYTPYADVKGTTVKRYGRNLFSNDTSEIKQVSWVGNDGKERKYFGYDIRLSVGTYYVHARRKSEAGEGAAFIYGYIIHKDGSGTALDYAPVAGTGYADKVFSITDGDRFYLYNGTGGALETTAAVFNAYNIQIELGEKATEFEPYDMVEAVADADGNVEGLISHAPNMVLITDNNEAVIECEYNRDANKVVTDLETKLNTLIATIGG